jgi:hypothetical protein
MSAGDAYWPDVIDGAGGGTWNPSDPIIIGGDGLAVTGPFSANNANITGTVSVIGNTTVNVLDVNDVATFTVGIAIPVGSYIDINTGSIMLESTGFTVGGGVPSTFLGTVDFNTTVIAAGSFTVLGATSLAATTATSIGVGGAITLNATTLSAASGVASTFAGTVSLTNTMTVGTTGRIAFSGAGRILQRFYTLPDADATVAISDGNFFIVPALGANRSYTLATTGAVLGDIACFSAFANATANTANVGSWFLRNSSGITVAVWQYFDGSLWRDLDISVRP